MRTTKTLIRLCGCAGLFASFFERTFRKVPFLALRLINQGLFTVMVHVMYFNIGLIVGQNKEAYYKNTIYLCSFL